MSIFQKSRFSTLFSILFSVVLILAVLIKQLPFAILGVYLAVSIATFLAYAVDKSAAQSNCWRIQERTLHLFAMLGGWPGAVFAQKTLRHKSNKPAFQVTFWATVVVNCIMLGWLLTTSGATFLNAIMFF